MADFQDHPTSKPLLGVSSCLLGAGVRFDGGHKRASFVSDDLAQYVEFVPVCPEIEVGLGTPRESIRLVKGQDGVRLVGSRTGADHTDEMRDLAARRVADLESKGVSGFVLKSKSPTCGMANVRLYGANGVPSRSGVGLFAAELKRRMPLLPMEEEGRLNDAGLRADFVRKVFAHFRARCFFESEWTIGDLVGFHQREKLMLKAHDPIGARELGRIVALASVETRSASQQRYVELFMSVISKRMKRGAHDSLFQRMLGGLRSSLRGSEYLQLRGVLADFRNGFVSLEVPRALMAHYARLRGVSYLSEQSYFQPYPPGLLVTEGVF